MALDLKDRQDKASPWHFLFQVGSLAEVTKAVCLLFVSDDDYGSCVCGQRRDLTTNCRLAAEKYIPSSALSLSSTVDGQKRLHSAIPRICS